MSRFIGVFIMGIIIHSCQGVISSRSNDTQEENQELVTKGNTTNVMFMLYNREHKEGTQLEGGEDDLDKFLAEMRLVLITHGWQRGADSPSVMEIVRGYLQFHDMNIVTVDWSSLSKAMYISASWATKEVGGLVGERLVELHLDGVCRLEETHLIGHSLGAHVLGIAGARVWALTGRKVARITGLDPAGPIFEYVSWSTESKLDPEDADFVDAIHTDPVVGYAGRLAQADYFPNGGLAPQPGCTEINDIWCSHKRAFQYFVESIRNSSAFLSTQCDSYKEYLKGHCKDRPKAHMGHFAPASAKGAFYLKTRSSSAYSL